VIRGDNSFSGRHARPEHGIRNGGASSVCSPQPVFYPVADQRSRKRLPTTPVETDFSMRAFTRQH